MKSWMLSSLLGVGAIVGAACANSDPAEAGTDPETAISELPLSAACSTCAQNALSGACSAELAACASDPACFDVGACIAGCAPNDAACFSACAQSSVLFDDLATCVLCDTCGQECAGEWTCNNPPPPPPPGGCDNSGDCASCSVCASGADCANEAVTCVSSQDCNDLAQCALGCNGDPSCLADCINQFPNGLAEFEPLVECVGCVACPNDCSQLSQQLGCSGSSSGNPGSCDNGGDCAQCASCAATGACAPELGACLQNPDCQAVVDCVTACGQPDCIEQCIQQNPSASPEIDALISCAVCDQCPNDCNGASLGLCP